MKNKHINVLVFLGLLCFAASAQTTIRVSAKVTNAPMISKYICSHFTRHLGSCIYAGFYVGDTSKIGGIVHLSLVNIDASKSKEIEVDFDQDNHKGVTGRLLTAQTLQAHNTFATPDLIQPVPLKSAVLKAGKLHVKLPPFSVAVLTII